MENLETTQTQDISLSDKKDILNKFLADNDVKSIKDFIYAILPLMNSMSDYTYKLKYKQKVKYRNAKLKLINLFFQNDMIDSIKRRISHTKDDLIQFKIGDYTFHLRTADVSFLNEDNYPLHESLYMKREVDIDNLDESFLEIFPLLQNIQDKRMYDGVDVLSDIKSDNIITYYDNHFGCGCGTGCDH